MARKRKATYRRGRRRVSGVKMSRNNLFYYAAIAAGYLMGDKVNDLLKKVTGTLDPKIVAGIELAAGFAIPKYLLKNMYGKIIGGLLLGAGAKQGLKAFNVISGYDGNMKVIQGRVAGMGYPLRDNSAYPSAMSVVNGMPDYQGSGNGDAY